MEIRGRVETIQTTALLITTRLLRRVLWTWEDLVPLTICQNLTMVLQPSSTPAHPWVIVCSWFLTFKLWNQIIKLTNHLFNNNTRNKKKIVLLDWLEIICVFPLNWCLCSIFIWISSFPVNILTKRCLLKIRFQEN